MRRAWRAARVATREAVDRRPDRTASPYYHAGDETSAMRMGGALVDGARRTLLLGAPSRRKQGMTVSEMICRGPRRRRTEARVMFCRSRCRRARWGRPRCGAGARARRRGLASSLLLRGGREAWHQWPPCRRGRGRRARRRRARDCPPALRPTRPAPSPRRDGGRRDRTSARVLVDGGGVCACAVRRSFRNPEPD